MSGEQKRREVVVTFVRAETGLVAMRFPVPAGHSPQVPAVVAAALQAAKPPMMTIDVEEVES